MLRSNLACMFPDVVYCNDIFLNVNSQHVIQDKTNEFLPSLVLLDGDGISTGRSQKCVLDDAATICQPITFI